MAIAAAKPFIPFSFSALSEVSPSSVWKRAGNRTQRVQLFEMILINSSIKIKSILTREENPENLFDKTALSPVGCVHSLTCPQ
jgi:hypothetical protein